MSSNLLPPTDLLVKFPNWMKQHCNKTSDETRDYNCIAWAMGDNQKWWWPVPIGQAAWPKGIPRQETIDAFARAFATRGFLPTTDGTLLPQTEKVALYTKDHVPTHAARQLPNGHWTSKIGQFWDVEHALGALEGPEYGRATHFFARLIA